MDSLRTGAERICNRLTKAGHRALFAGGCVRDQLLGRPPKDYDIATDARPEQIAALFERTIGVGASFGVQVVLEPEGQYEVATFRVDGPYLDGRRPSTVEFCDAEADAQRRDFTINALFFDPVEDTIVDYVGGQDDLKQGIVRAVGDPQARFQEDHLRLLRAIRFAARLDYAIEPDTTAAITELAHLAPRTSAERIRDELLKLLTEGGARRAFELLDATGLLEHILPEVAEMKGVEQPPQFHPEGDVFVHTLLMLGHLDKLDGPSPTLALATLLHDVGKPQTQTETDRIRFNQHDSAGAQMARFICNRLRMSNEDTERVVWLVGQHMRLALAPKMRESKLKRFVREEGFDELIELCRLDCLASHGSLKTIAWVEEYVANLTPEEARPEPLIRGDDLIALGFQPGPVFKEILRTVEDLQLEHRLLDAESALRFVQDNWRVQ